LVVQQSYVRNERLPALETACELHRGVLSFDECAEVIHRAESAGFEAMGRCYPSGYRNNDRLVIDDPALGARLWARVAPRLRREWIAVDGSRWRVQGLNERFRFCRYRDGQSFTVHRDGAHWRGPEERSWLTLQVYLNDGSQFGGGATRFYAAAGSRQPQWEMAPEAGAAIVFSHALWHDGAPVTRGTKYVMRTDVMLRRGGPALVEEPAEVIGRHEGYVWAILALTGGRVVSASRDRTIRIWRPGPGERWREERRLEGHGASVTALLADRRGQLWSGARDGGVRSWSEPGGSREVGRHGGAVVALCRVGAEAVASAGADGRIRLFALGGSAIGERAVATGWVWSLAEAGPRSWLSAGDDGVVRRWSLDALEPSEEVSLGEPVRAVALAANGEVAVGLGSGRVLLAGRELSRHGGSVTCLLVLADGTLASGGEDGVVRLHGEPRRELVHGDFVRAIAEHREGILTAGYEGLIRRWRL
jgi:predicted 2-oxoglutarate/Fe(II)-dependent dioxygenase YbiX